MSVFTLVERLGSGLEREVNLVLNSEQEAETLTSRLKKIQNGLEDAERKGATDASVKDWLKQIEDIAYEIDDVLDEWEMANLQVKLQGTEDDLSGLWNQVRSLAISLCLCFKHTTQRREIALKMKSLSDRIDAILVEERNRYNFVPTESNHAGDRFKQPETTSVITQPRLYGRDSDEESLMKKLISIDKEESEGAQIVSIVGIGGVGKTTLARSVYNHPEMESHFGLKAWVSVPDPFDSSVVARRILEVFGINSANIQTLEALFRLIKEAVKEQRFLLILDNVWSDDGTNWKSLKSSLFGAPGSRILVTTRNEFVAGKMGTRTAQLQSLGILSDQDCQSILDEMALDGKSEEESQILRKIGHKIAKKCNGLPLAATSVGSMLATRSTVEQWEDVLSNPLWENEDGESDLFRLLKLSYVDLSPVLKRCFLSCIVCPRGSTVYLDQMIRIWMAYGYLSSKSYESKVKGLEYFDKLAMRSFFQRLETDDVGVTSFKVHDIMYDFAIYLSNPDYNFIMDSGLHNMSQSSFGGMRTFCASHSSQQELPLDQLQRVRVLRINECSFQELPQEIGKLIHLRYLDLSNNPLEELSEFVSDLYNLQTLVLENCVNLSKLPQRIGKLINLRHLLNRGTKELKQFPHGLGKLTDLRTLSEFRAGRVSELGILGNLNQLEGDLLIFLPELNDMVDNLKEVRKANLEKKSSLRKLELFFQDEEQTDYVVDALQPPPGLKSLIIHTTSSKWLSHWITRASFDSIKVVEFYGNQKCFDLPPFGKLPTLEKLIISRCTFKCLSVGLVVGTQGDFENDAKSALSSTKGMGWFPKLKKLELKSCLAWKEWEDIREGAHEYPIPMLPFLEELIIDYCVKLHALPHRLLQQVNSLQHLEIRACRLLHERYYRWYDGDEISHIPHVIFNMEHIMEQLKENIRVSFVSYTAALKFLDGGADTSVSN